MMPGGNDENSFDKELKHVSGNIVTKGSPVKTPKPTVLSNIFNSCTVANVTVNISDKIV